MTKKYRVKIEKQAVKQLKKMDKFTARMIYDWIMANLEYTDNPRLHGKSLSANRTGEWRYRIGNYRALAIIDDKEIRINIFTIGHRSTVYERK